jgi:carboxyl-terminal processing protease
MVEVLISLVLAVVLALGAVPQGAALHGAAPRAPAPQGVADAVATFDAVWNIVNETHFDSEFNGVDWVAVRNELRPRAETAETADELRGVINEMLGRLGQSHFRLWPGSGASTMGLPTQQAGAGESGGEGSGRVADLSGQVGFEVVFLDGRFLVMQVSEDGPAAAAGVKPGWVVLTPLAAELAGEIRILAGEPGETAARARAAEAVVADLDGSPGSKVEISFLDDSDDQVKLEVERQRLSGDGELMKFGNLPPMRAQMEYSSIAGNDGETFGLIQFNIWLPLLARPFDEAIDNLRDVDGMIIDLRGNRGGLGAMVMGTAGHFLDEPVSLGTMQMRDNELSYVTNPRRVNRAGERVDPFPGPLAILVDGSTASTSEVFAGGLQAVGRARIFGQATMGAVLPSLLDSLPNGDVLQHAIADFATADGRQLEGYGVIPDEQVMLQRDDLTHRHDATLAAAIAWMTEESARRKE